MKSALGGVALAAMIVAATSAFAADPIKIGLSGPFTGGSASMGVSMRDGVKLAVDEINKAGGILGRPIQLVERDDEAKNEVSVQIAQELVNKEQVAATLGFINTGRRARGPALLSGSGNPGDQQCRDRHIDRETIHAAGLQEQLRVPHVRQRHHPERHDRE